MADPYFEQDAPTPEALLSIGALLGGILAASWMLYAHTCPTPEPKAVPETIVVEEPVFVAEVTAYSPKCKGCTSRMYNGERPDPDKRTVAAHLPSWPIGSCVELLIPETGWTHYTVTDTGAAIDDEDKFDILLPTQRAAKKWGRKHIAARRVECT